MTNTVLIKRSGVANSVPAAGNLSLGELAINYADGNLFYKNSSGSVTVIASNKFLSVTGNVTGGNINSGGIVSATGNVIGNYFIGNGSQLTGITVVGTLNSVVDNFTGNGSQVAFVLSTAPSSINVTWVNIDGVEQLRTGYSLAGSTITFSSPPASGASIEITTLSGSVGSNTSIASGTSNVSIGAANANVTVSVNGTGNVVVFANTGAYVTGVVSATGNVTGNYIVGNGSLLTGVVATGIGTLTSLSVTGNITTGNLLTGGLISVAGNITGGNLTTTGIASVGSLSVTGNVLGNLLPSANITYDLGSATQAWRDLYLSGTSIKLGAATITSSGTSVSVGTGNVIGGNITTGGLISASGNITGGNILAGSGIISTSGNITGNNISGTIIGTVVTANASLTGNLTANNGMFTTIVNTASFTGGLVSVTGQITGSQFNGSGAGLTSIPGANVTGTVPNATTAVVAGTVTTAAQANITSVGTLSSLAVTANATANNFIATTIVSAASHTGTLVSVTGNVNGGNLISAALVQGATVSSSGNVVTVGIAATGNISTTGNISGGNFIGSIAGTSTSLTGNLNANNVIATTIVNGASHTGGLVSVTGQITGGNISATGISSATTDFRLGGLSYSRVAVPDGGGGFVGGYNTTYSSGVVYDSSSAPISAIYYGSDGNLKFYSGPSATAGTAAPERMRIDTSGNVGINTTSPGAKLGIAMPYNPGGTPGLKVTMAGGGTGAAADAVCIDLVLSGLPNYDTTYGIRSVISGGGTGQAAYAGWFKGISGNSNTPNTGVYVEMASTGSVGLAGDQYAVYAYANSAASGVAGSNWALAAVTSNQVHGKALYVNDAYSTAGSKTLAQFNRAGTLVGTISTSLTATSYNTSSTSGLIGVDASTVAFNTASSERMRIDSSGNVGIGNGSTVTASKQLYIFTAANSLQIQSVVRNSNTGTGVAAIGFNVAHTSEGDYTQAGIGLVRGIANGSGALCFYNKGSGTASDFTTADEKMRIDSSGNLLVGTSSQIKGSKQSIYSGATNATTYNTASFQGGSVLTVQNQQTTSVSTSAVVIATTGIYATLAIVFGSDGTNRFQDLLMFGLGTGTVNVINSFTVGGSPASRTYSQSSSTYRLAMGSGTYTVQFSGLSQGD